jgi:hypothetical protein
MSNLHVEHGTVAKLDHVQGKQTVSDTPPKIPLA